MNLKPSPQIVVGIVLTTALGLSACSGEVDTSALEKKVRVAQEGSVLGSEKEEIVEPEEPGEPEDFEGSTDDSGDSNVQTSPVNPGSGSYNTPAWANEVTEVGELIETVEEDWLRIDIYHVADGTASEDSLVTHPDTEEPVMEKGDPVSAMNFIATNTGTQEVTFGALFLMPIMTFPQEDTFLGAMMDINDEWMAELGLHPDPFHDFDAGGFALAPGESFAQAEIYERKADRVQITFDITVYDESGNLDFDSPFSESIAIDLEFDEWYQQ